MTINEILEVEDSYQAPQRMMDILSDKEKRLKIYKAFLEKFDYDLSYDWFHDYFQEEHAERKSKKQDFTPNCISDTLSALLDNDKPLEGTIYEPSAGTGGVLIRKWWNDRKRQSFLTYSPNRFRFICFELSPRAIPFLIFNLSIRGVNAGIIHGNTLTNEEFERFYTVNTKNDYLGFSNIYIGNNIDKSLKE